MSKKKIVFGTLMCGTILLSTVTPSVVQASEVMEQTDEQESKDISFKVTFILNGYDIGTGTVSGKIDSKVDITNQIPTGYELKNSSDKMVTLNRKLIDKGIYIEVEGAEYDETLQFLDQSDLDKTFPDKIITVKTGSHVLTSQYVPQGYELLSQSDNDFFCGKYTR